MDALERVLRALEQGKSLEEALSELPPQEAERIRPEAEAAAWLYRQEPALDQAASSWQPHWERVQPHLQPRQAPAAQRPRPRRGWAWPQWQRAWQFAVAAMLAALVLLGGTWTAVSAQHALPGDWRYPIKRLLEDTQYYLSPDPASRAALEITFAQRRLEESEALLKQGKTKLAAQTLTVYQRHVQNALQWAQKTSLPPEEAQTLASQAQTQAQMLERLRYHLPPQERQAAQAGEEVAEQAAAFFRGHGRPPAHRPPAASATVTATPTPSPTGTITPTVTATATETVTPTETPLTTATGQSYQWQWQGEKGNGNGP